MTENKTKEQEECERYWRKGFHPETNDIEEALEDDD